MNALRLQFLKQQEVYLRILSNIITGHHFIPISYVTTVDTVDPYASEIIRKHKHNDEHFTIPLLNIQRHTDGERKKTITELSENEIDSTIQQLVQKNKDKNIEQLIEDCLNAKKIISDKTLKFLFKHYSNVGKPEIIVLLQKYCSKLLPTVLKRNGDFIHYLAKAQCFKGNSEKGLSLMKESFIKSPNIISVHRIIFRELIVDSVKNRSEASLVVFKKYVLEFSKEYEEHYPLVCLWHICWLSQWYSDQMLANELWESSKKLRNLISEKVTQLCISALWSEYNDDAVVRLLQVLLKYKMMAEYRSILQVLFDYKLKNRDVRGCTEILKNCDILGITLPSHQQGRYIKLLIHGQLKETKPQLKSKEFKLKF